VLTNPNKESVWIVEQIMDDTDNCLDDTLSEITLAELTNPNKESVCIVEHMIEDRASCPDDMFRVLRINVLTYPVASV
jgi:DNA-binding IscR family transcriptional regulator